MKPIRVSLALLCVLVLAGLPGAVLAHASLQEAYPAPDARLSASPAEFRLTFSEPILTGSTFAVHGSGGQPVPDLNPVVDGAMLRASVLIPLADGAYTVEWMAVVDDGSTEGRYKFRVGQPLVPIWAWALGGVLVVLAAGGIWLRSRGRAEA